jgi:hypothetical protein
VAPAIPQSSVVFHLIHDAVAYLSLLGFEPVYPGDETGPWLRTAEPAAVSLIERDFNRGTSTVTFDTRSSSIEEAMNPPVVPDFPPLTFRFVSWNEFDAWRSRNGFTPNDAQTLAPPQGYIRNEPPAARLTITNPEASLGQTIVCALEYVNDDLDAMRVRVESAERVLAHYRAENQDLGSTVMLLQNERRTRAAEEPWHFSTVEEALHWLTSHGFVLHSTLEEEATAHNGRIESRHQLWRRHSPAMYQRAKLYTDATPMGYRLRVFAEHGVSRGFSTIDQAVTELHAAGWRLCTTDGDVASMTHPEVPQNEWAANLYRTPDRMGQVRFRCTRQTLTHPAPEMPIAEAQPVQDAVEPEIAPTLRQRALRI